jgi:hypothetical protein
LPQLLEIHFARAFVLKPVVFVLLAPPCSVLSTRFRYVLRCQFSTCAAAACGRPLCAAYSGQASAAARLTARPKTIEPPFWDCFDDESSTWDADLQQWTRTDRSDLNVGYLGDFLIVHPEYVDELDGE